MLNLINPESVETAPILEVVREFRRVQVSRFPLDVKFTTFHRGDGALFFDSRIQSKTALAKVWQDEDEKGNKFWIVESRLINNDRYVRGNDRKHQKHTKDPKKLLRYMRDAVRPYSAKEIAKMSEELREHHVDMWKHQALAQMRTMCDIDRGDVMREMLRMRAVGYKPQTEKFAQVMEQGLAAWEEANRRTKRNVMQVHVFINPDESVEVFCDDKLGYRGINQGVTTYASLAEAPECIQQHVAMLRMMDDKAFIPEVGTKVDARNYWVEVFPE